MSDEEQNRLQQYCDVGAPPVETRPPTCDRCGADKDLSPVSTAESQISPAEHHTGFRDIREFGEQETYQLCDDCTQLHKYLHYRHAQVTDRAGVVGAVAVFCQCHDDDEVDVCPLRQGETPAGVRCSRCGTAEVVVEELPPTPQIEYEVEQ